MTEKKRLGRPPTTGKTPNRNIRLTDHQWKVFCAKLGPDWLRKQIAKADTE